MKKPGLIHLRHPEGCVPALLERGAKSLVLIGYRGEVERFEVSDFADVIHAPAGCVRPEVNMNSVDKLTYAALGPAPYAWSSGRWPDGSKGHRA